MRLYTNKSLLFLSVFIFTLSFFSSCKKDRTCNGKISVVMLSNGAVVPNAKIRMYVPKTGAGFFECNGSTKGNFVTETILYTDGSGTASFCLSQPATPSLEVTLGLLKGTGVIATEVGKTVNTTVKIQ